VSIGKIIAWLEQFIKAGIQDIEDAGALLSLANLATFFNQAATEATAVETDIANFQAGQAVMFFHVHIPDIGPVDIVVQKSPANTPANIASLASNV